MKPALFESFTYPFFDFNYSIDSPKLVDSFLDYSGIKQLDGKKSIYIHIPFCDSICTFCPFVKTVGDEERIANYVFTLAKEMRLLSTKNKLKNWNIDCVYFGGGTPSVLSNKQISFILKNLRENFNIKENAEITFEMEAKSVDDDSMSFLKTEGITRVSFGLQTFDADIRKMVNLTASLDDLHRTISLFDKYFPNANNMDMMVGFPGQTSEDSLRDVKMGLDSGISSISIYPVDYVVTLSRLIEKIRVGEIPKPASPESRRQMFFDSRQLLKTKFKEFNVYSYGVESVPPSSYMFDILYGDYNHECIGLGCGSYSSIQGLTYQNIAAEKIYTEHVNNGKLPIRIASPYHAYEKGLVFFPKLLRYDISKLKELGLMEIYEPIIEKLIDKCLIKKNASTIRLTKKGELYYAELMVLFMSTNQKRIYNSVCKRFEETLGWNGNNSIFESPVKDRNMGTMRAMST